MKSKLNLYLTKIIKEELFKTKSGAVGDFITYLTNLSPIQYKQMTDMLEKTGVDYILDPQGKSIRINIRNPKSSKIINKFQLQEV